MNAKLTSSDNIHKKMLSMEEASNYTSLSKSYLYKLTHSKKIPHYKPGGKLLYFLKQDLDQYLMRNRVSSAEEIDAEAVNYVVNGEGGET